MAADVRQLRIVLALARYGSFHRAARALGVSQPALSRSLKTLERDLGGRLFDRGGPGGVEPTPLGRVLLERGVAVVKEHGELLREVRMMQGLEIGRLAASAAFFPAHVCVPLAVGRLVREHPRIEVRTSVANWRICTDEVLSGNADVAIADLGVALGNPQLEVEPIARHPFVFVCREGHPILAAERVTRELLFSYPWAVTRGPVEMARFFPKPPFAAGRIDPATEDFVPAVLVADVASSHAVALESDALGAAVPPRATGRPLPPGLVEVPFEDRWMRLNYGLITRKGRTQSPAAQAFMAEIRAVEASMPGAGAEPA